MSAMAVVLVDELTNILEKVQARKPSFLLRRKTKESMAALEDEENEQGVKSSPSVLKSKAMKSEDSTLSEATVCLLMDRFAPC